MGEMLGSSTQGQVSASHCLGGCCVQCTGPSPASDHPAFLGVACSAQAHHQYLSILLPHLLDLKVCCKKNASFETGLQEGDTGQQGLPFVCMGKNSHQHKGLSLYHSCIRKGRGCPTTQGCFNPVLPDELTERKEERNTEKGLCSLQLSMLRD